MAGIEQLEVHSKSYIVRWLKVDESHTISWSVQPHKKSINFGIVKHPGSGGTGLASNQPEDLGTVTSGVDESNKSGRFAKRDAITAQDQLANKGFVPIKWHGKCEADKVTLGTHDVQPGQSGMFGLVFDNTFSKQTSKTITLVLMTYPTGAPPQTTQNLPNLSVAMGSNKASSGTSLGRQGSPHLNAVASDSLDSLHGHLSGGAAASISGRSDGSGNHHTGNLLKRRRKKGQGFARRYFCLDYSSCTLSYYYNRNSSALRGAIPLSLAAIAADERRREISIDSGAEIWHLRASNPKDFSDWARALEKASRIARGLESTEPTDELPSIGKAVGHARTPSGHLRPGAANTAEDREWEQVESLVSRTVGTRDALRRLVKDMAITPKASQPNNNHFLSPSGSAASEETDGYFPSEAPKKSFWKRKSSAATSTSQGMQPAASSALAVPSPLAVATTGTANGLGSVKKTRGGPGEEKNVEDHCGALLTDLDSVIAEFTTLIANSKRRRLQPTASMANSRLSIDTNSTEEFFDAEAGDTGSQIVKIGPDEDDDDEDVAASDADEDDVHDSSSISSVDEDQTGGLDESSCFPTKVKSLAPLPVDISVERRTKIPPATVQPPSLIAFVRKNVGKDLSAISMPVSANEPVSMLQRSAEQLEYAQLLDQAAQQKSPQDRLLYVTAFAISHFSGSRAKERANRKPYNPLLGETFELLRTEQEVPGGFRLLVEKVSHRPVRLAMQADSATWSFSQTPAPSQKFWGKSAEVTTDGRVRVALRTADGGDERYSWTHATMFLRNVVMGEKYVEPVGTMHVNNESTGARAAVDFRSKGVFGGRGEDVHVETFDPDGANTGMGLTGTWTGSLRRTEAGKPVGEDVWRAGKLVEDAVKTYGLTEFAATLNEMTEVERGRLPPTDTRLRPDQRKLEDGDLDGAEHWKVKLEEAQRERRRELEESGETYQPKWFVKAGDGPEGEEVWKLKAGKDSYWEERTKGQWSGVGDIFLSQQQ